MEAFARAPDPLTKDGNMASNWQSWKEDFIIFMKVTGYINKSNEIRANLLKNRIGKVGIEAIQSISFDNEQDKDDMDILIRKLGDYFDPPKKEAVERYNFFTRTRKNESLEQYINILKEKAKTCNFNDMTDSIIRDKIILDTQDKILRKKFFEADNLDLQKLVMIYNDYNINTEKMKPITKEKTATQITKENAASFTQKPLDNNVKKGNCWRCDHQHPQGKCAAWGSKCTKCNELNHFTHCCNNKASKSKTNNDKVNKNLLSSMQQTTLTAKNNDKWNNQADFAAKTTDPMKIMINLPDIQGTSCGTPNLTVGNDPTSDFIIVNTHDESSKLCYNNTMSQSVPNTQYSHSHMKEAKPDWLTDLYNREEKIQSTPEQTKIADTSEISDKKPKKNRKKKSNEDTSKKS